MMLPYLGSTILDVSLKNALSLCQRVILVTGFRGQELMALYQHHPRIHLVYNEHYQQGMFSSIRCAVSQINSDYFFITHGDMPCIPPAVFYHLWQQRGTCALLPCYQGQQGHPVLLPSTLKELILKAADDSQMRSILQTVENRLVPIENAAICRDIDTEGAYQQLLTDEHNNSETGDQ